MQRTIPVRSAPLSQQIAEILIRRIRSGIYPPDAQLPPEHDLAAEFHVSRATVRSATSALAARGLVVRRQGVGTFASRLSRISNPLNEALDFHEMITGDGHRFGVQVVGCEWGVAEARLADLLQVDPGDPVLRSHKIFTADGNAVIFCINTLPGWLLDEEASRSVLGRPESTEPFFEFLRTRLGQTVEYHVAHLKPEIAADCPFPGLPLQPSAPLLVIEEVGFNSEERPIWHALEYFPGGAMTFELVRQRSR